MKIKYFISAALILSVSMAFNGCNKEKKVDKAVTSNKKYADDVKTSDSMTVSFDDIISDFTVKGVKLSFPVTIDELGEGYSYDKSSTLITDDLVSCYLMYKQQMIGTCQMTGVTDDNYNNKPMSMISIVNKGKQKADPSYTDASLGGISMDSGLTDVTSKLGDPQKAVFNPTDESYLLTYIKDDDNKIEVEIDDTVDKIVVYYAE